MMPILDRLQQLTNKIRYQTDKKICSNCHCLSRRPLNRAGVWKRRIMEVEVHENVRGNELQSQWRDSITRKRSGF